ncbi:MAG: hypothetical protein AB1485_00905 [Candidatus Thermoplasmatota archaeon]
MSVIEILQSFISHPVGITLLILLILCGIAIYLCVRKKIVLKLPPVDLNELFTLLERRFKEKFPVSTYAIAPSPEKRRIAFEKLQEVRLFGVFKREIPLRLMLYFEPKGKYTMVKYISLYSFHFFGGRVGVILDAEAALLIRKFLKREILPLVKEVAELIPKTKLFA